MNSESFASMNKLMSLVDPNENDIVSSIQSFGVVVFEIICDRHARGTHTSVFS